MTHRPRIVIIGAGFGGLHAARQLANEAVDVLLIDRNNYHTFTPLLYQVATCGLEAEEIAYPVRSIFRGDANIAFLLGDVTGVDTERQVVDVRTVDGSRQERYDYLIVAAGSVTNYFDMTPIEAASFDLKELTDAVILRNHILHLFERAVWAEDAEYRKALTTIVVVGGGPTGLETAGALRELYTHVLNKEFASLSPQVILIEATDRDLAPFPETLQRSAIEQLESLDVEVVLGNPVVDAGSDYIVLKDGRIIHTHTLIWSAGVKASPLALALGVRLQRGGRVPVLPTLEAEGVDNVYVIGDMAYLEDEGGQPYPMLIPVAKQQGILAAKNILRRLKGWQQQPFAYIDRGIMATIGRSRAVAYIFNHFKLSGYFAWIAWLGLHLVALLGFRNRLNVMVNWVWNYFTYDRSVRIILEAGGAGDDGDQQVVLFQLPVRKETEPVSVPRW